MRSAFSFSGLALAAAILLTACSSEQDPLFRTVAPESSGVTFNNRIQHADTLSVIDFEYMYNGAGVGVGDINNDGLQDLYFTGNMTTSRLYLNKGGMKFEEITDKAGVGTSTWANGVCMADFNQDGFTDIYVSVGGHRFTPEEKRNNLLFINNGNLTFTESAAAYGLDDKGYNVQAALIDYDMDGDQDVYLLRNSFVSYSRNMSRPRELNGEAYSTDKLFRNNGNNTYSDVSREAGILTEGFGLGVNIAYLNNDCWPDIYVSNDFLSNDLMWINNGNGTFTNQAAKLLKHQTFNAMGNDVADFNNDGFPDIVVVDMLPEDNKRWKLTPRGNNYDEFEKGLRMGYEPQYIRNTLQLNNGNGTFSEIGQLAGIEATEWSWSALFADFDHDGLKDLFISNGYGKDITNQDFIVYGEEGQTMGLPAATKKERQDLLNKIPGVKLSNYMYRNRGDLTFEDATANWGFSAPTYSNGAAYADLDNDGDLDMIINNIDDPASIMENRLRINGEKEKSAFLRLRFKGPKGNLDGYGARVEIRQDSIVQHQVYSPWRGYLSTVEPLVHFGLQSPKPVQQLIVTWPDGSRQVMRNVAANQILILDHAQAVKDEKPCAAWPADDSNSQPLFSDVTGKSVSHQHQENYFVDFKVQPALPHMHSRNGPGLAAGDVNGDGSDDLFIGGASGSSGGLFFQQPDGTFAPSVFAPYDSLAEMQGTLLFDADGDGDNDLYIVSGGSEHEKESEHYQDVLYINNGKGVFSHASGALPKENGSGSCVTAADFDRDGDLDLFTGGRVMPSAYPSAVASSILRNDSKPGNPLFTDITAEAAPELNQDGMVCTALWTDVDQDGWPDLMVAGEFTPLVIYRNNKGRLTERNEIGDSRGWWNSLTAGDFDADGDLDYVAGNLGLNSHFHATAEEPLCIHARDFNNDGRLDPVMSYYVQGERYIGHPRDVLVDQINSMRARFRSFKEYSEATFEQSFLPEELADAYEICAERFENSYLENLGNGDFRLKALPLIAQAAPLYGMAVEDVNSDGFPDLVAIGNAYSPEVISGRDDASTGLFMTGGPNGLSAVPTRKSGFLADRDGKGFVRLSAADGSTLFAAGNNSGPLSLYRCTPSGLTITPMPGETAAMAELTDGRKVRMEFPWGSGYLSQSSRTFRLPAGTIAVQLFNFEQKTRSLNTGKR